jgi:membrane-bound ClpP family serine protease
LKRERDEHHSIAKREKRHDFAAHFVTESKNTTKNNAQTRKIVQLDHNKIVLTKMSQVFQMSEGRLLLLFATLTVQSLIFQYLKMNKPLRLVEWLSSAVSITLSLISMKRNLRVLFLTNN